MQIYTLNSHTFGCFDRNEGPKHHKKKKISARTTCKRPTIPIEVKKNHILVV